MLNTTLQRVLATFSFVLIGSCILFMVTQHTFNLPMAVKTSMSQILNDDTRRVTFKPNSSGASEEFRYRVPIPVNCEVRMFSNTPLPITALASIPGSGNTWSRHIIELLTGIYTGSRYNDGSLKNVFRGEVRQDWSVVAIKTHGQDLVIPAHECGFVVNKRDCQLKRVILVIRHPMAASLAEFKRRNTRSHTMDITREITQKEWEKFYSGRAKKWQYFHATWLENGDRLNLDIFLLFYADLVHNFTTAVANLAYFLVADGSKSRIHCLLDHSEGLFHRISNKTMSPELREDTNTRTAIETVRKLTGECIKRRRCATSGSTWLL